MVNHEGEHADRSDLSGPEMGGETRAETGKNVDGRGQLTVAGWDEGRSRREEEAWIGGPACDGRGSEGNQGKSLGEGRSRKEAAVGETSKGRGE